ncbi:MAG: HDOD domain-containing protein, partial [Lentisphaerota bacterium]
MKKAVTGGKDLATLWGVAQKVREITSNQHASVKELVKVISADSVLTSKVLRLVNSAAYGFSGRIANIDQAIVILGFRQLRDLCVGLSVMKSIGMEPRCSQFNRGYLWRHSLGTAVACKLIQDR